MPVYFQGSEIQDFGFVSNGNAFNEVYNGRFNATNSRGTVRTYWDGYVDTPTLPNISEFWFHVVMYPDLTTAAAKRFIEFQSGGTSRLGFISSYSATNGFSFDIQKYDGASPTWTTISSGPANSLLNSTLATYDFYIKLGNPGTISIYRNGVPVYGNNALNLTWSAATVTSFDKLRLSTNINNLSYNMWYSEIILADFNTIGSRLVTRAPDAAGDFSEWTNTFTNVNEFIAANTYISSNIVNQRFSANCAAFPTLGPGETIESVKVIGTGLRDMTGPQNVNLFLKTNATVVDDNDVPLTIATMNFSNTWAQNPVTSTKWTKTDLDNLQIGVRSRT